ncbi:hypothetical protein JTE90_027385 [Oedothorax gibbosus]|uniref:Secreted protein n=1 Tax=Oedothorax gibbosus TaxID=931172 RepID=A0AAV6VZ56_9ARAC|nr:hypothetical protein JTE90_027385 [Oedothorax gibbosus]
MSSLFFLLLVVLLVLTASVSLADEEGPSFCQLPRVMVAMSSSSRCWICISKLCCWGRCCRCRRRMERGGGGSRWRLAWCGWCQMRNELGLTRDAFRDKMTHRRRMPTPPQSRYRDQEISQVPVDIQSRMLN